MTTAAYAMSSTTNPSRVTVTNTHLSTRLELGGREGNTLTMSNSKIYEES